MAALLLTCDLVNPYHERKDLKKKKKRRKIGDYIHKKKKKKSEVGARDKQGEKADQPRGTQARPLREKRENKIVQFGGTGERKGNINTERVSLSHSAVSSVPK